MRGLFTRKDCSRIKKVNQSKGLKNRANALENAELKKENSKIPITDINEMAVFPDIRLRGRREVSLADSKDFWVA